MKSFENVLIGGILTKCKFQAINVTKNGYILDDEKCKLECLYRASF
jgi:hypothetical protein